MSFGRLLLAERKLLVLQKCRIPEPRMRFSSTSSPLSSSTDRLPSAVSFDEREGCQIDGTDASSEKHVTLQSKASLREKEKQKQSGTWYSIQKYLTTFKEKVSGTSVDKSVSSVKNTLISAARPVLRAKSETIEDTEAAEANKLVVKNIRLSQSSSHSVCSIPPHPNGNLDKMAETDHESNLKCAVGSREIINPVVSKVFSEDDSVTKVDNVDLTETESRERKQVLGMKTILQRRKVNFASDKSSTESGADLSVLHVFSGNKSTEMTIKQSQSSVHSVCNMLPHANEKAAFSVNMSVTDHELKLKSTESSLEVVKEKSYPVASRTFTEDGRDTKVDQLDLDETKPCQKKQVLGMATILQRRKDNIVSDKISTESREDLSSKHAFSGNKESYSVVGILKECKKVTAAENENISLDKNPKLETSQIVAVMSSKSALKKSKRAKSPSLKRTGLCLLDFNSVLDSNTSNSSKNGIYLKPLVDCFKNLPSKQQKKEQVNQTSPITSGVSAMDMVKPLMSFKPDEEENVVHLKFQEVSEVRKEITSEVNEKVAVSKSREMVDFCDKTTSDDPDSQCKLVSWAMENGLVDHSIQITKSSLPNNGNNCDIASLGSPGLKSSPKFSSDENGSIHIPFSGTGKSSYRNCLLMKFLPKWVKENDIAVALRDYGSTISINIVQTPLEDKFNYAFIYFQSRNGLEKAAAIHDFSLCNADVVIESNLTSSFKVSDELFSDVKVGPDFPVDRLKRPSHTVAVVNMPCKMSFYDLENAFSRYGHITGFAMGSTSTAYIEFESKDSVEKVLVSGYLLGKLRIHRVEPPLTTVLRISRLNPKTILSKVRLICDDFGDVWRIVPRDADIIDVHYKTRELPNMLHIINRLNAMVVDQNMWSVKPATVFPPAILRRLWGMPDGRRHICCLIQELCRKIETHSVDTSAIFHLSKEYYECKEAMNR